MKKIIVLLLVLSIVITLFIPIIANAEPEDIFLSSGKILETLGVLQGNDNGNLMLNDNLSRQDMVVLVSRLYKEETKAKTFLVKPKFTDLTEKYAFYHSYIAWSVDKGLIKGMGNDLFGVDRNVTVHQFMVVLLRVLGYEEESRLWTTVPELAVTLGIMKGLENNATEDLSRGQMAVMTLNALRMTTKGSTLTLADKLNLKID